MPTVLDTVALSRDLLDYCNGLQALHGTDQEQARWRVCVNYVNENFGMAVGRMFVAKHFDDNAKANVGILYYSNLYRRPI